MERGPARGSHGKGNDTLATGPSHRSETLVPKTESARWVERTWGLEGWLRCWLVDR